ncbi:hypothetical protein M0R45_035418 [Rubus argutus]|uniref:mRNA export factor GLE1 n=1 Tax=Rubus argutus TaxID=59490 RepID=A0AAW1VT22_RUBAR
MAAAMLELRWPQNVDGISLDPEPDWSIEDLVSELYALEIKINSTYMVPLPLTKARSQDLSASNSNGRTTTSTSPFVMRVTEDNMDGIDSEYEEVHDLNSVLPNRFNFDELYFSDDCCDNSDDELSIDGVVSGLLELSREHELKVKEKIRKHISTLEMEMESEAEKSASALIRVEKYIKERCEMDGKLDAQYLRNIAEALEKHLTLVRRDFELRSQIEERNMRIDASNNEDARRKKKLQEERAKQEAKKAALEPQSRTSNEAAARELASESALNLDRQRLQRKLKQLGEETQALRLSSKENFGKYEIQIGKVITKITLANVTTKADELFEIFNDPQCPKCISSAAYAKKIIANCGRPDNSPFAQAYTIVLVTSKFPQVMDPILAELHTACIYTVPKHRDEKLESADDYLEKLERVMKLYGALVQTEIKGVENAHGLKEGWAWLARFVKAPLPNFANKYTAAALIVFLEMAGFSLYKKYKIQFRKLLNTVSDYFLKALKEQGDSELNPYMAKIKSDIVGETFLCEPKGRLPVKSLLSNNCIPV